MVRRSRGVDLERAVRPIGDQQFTRGERGEDERHRAGEVEVLGMSEERGCLVELADDHAQTDEEQSRQQCGADEGDRKHFASRLAAQPQHNAETVLVGARRHLISRDAHPRVVDTRGRIRRLQPSPPRSQNTSQAWCGVRRAPADRRPGGDDGIPPVLKALPPVRVIVRDTPSRRTTAPRRVAAAATASGRRSLRAPASSVVDRSDSGPDRRTCLHRA